MNEFQGDEDEYPLKNSQVEKGKKNKPPRRKLNFNHVESHNLKWYKNFKDTFGSSDEEEKLLGFTDDEIKEIRLNCLKKLKGISDEEFILQSELISQGAVNSFFQRVKETIAVSQMKKKNPVGRPRRGTRSGTMMKSVGIAPASSGKSNRIRKPIVQTKESDDRPEVIPHSFCINSLPKVKRIQDVPIPTGPASRSGKFVVLDDTIECEKGIQSSFRECNEEVDEDEVEEEELQGARRSDRLAEKSLIQFRLCPMGIDDLDEYGFPVFIDRTRGQTPPKPLCFSCGSGGIDQLIYCWSCCECWHPFCTGDDCLFSSYVSTILPKSKSLVASNYDSCPDLEKLKPKASIEDSKSTESSKFSFSSLLSPPLTPMPVPVSELDDLERKKGIELQNLLSHWTCRRCSVCCICQNLSKAEPVFLRCVSCPRCVHKSCCNSGKKMTMEKWTCDNCFKCNSCKKLIGKRGAAEARAREISGQILCLECFRQKQKGSFCPVCDVCYSDDDYDTRMMECGKCERWIHGKCEQINEEHYQVLSNLPESIEYICRLCEDSSCVLWRKAVSTEITRGCESALLIFQKKAISTPRKQQVVESCKNTPHKLTKLDLNDQNETAEIPSPSGKENKTVVRELFPVRQGQESQEEVTLKLQRQKCYRLILNNKECNIELTDFTKYPNATSEVPKVECQLLPSPAPSIGEDQGKTECRTPTKTVVTTIQAETPFSPTKRFNTVLDFVLKKVNFQFTSVLSVYKETLHAIESADFRTDKGEIQKMKDHFVSSLSEVFPWFNPNDTERINSDVITNPVTSSEQLTTRFMNSRSTTTAPSSSSTNEKLKQPNPFSDVYWDTADTVDTRTCSFCHETGDSPPETSGRLLWAGFSEWVHVNCALWSSEVWEEENGALQQIGVALARSKTLSCEICEKKGASVSCCVQACTKSFHFPCALNSSCILLEDKGMFCPNHVNRAKGVRQEDMQVLRQVHVESEFLRKKEKKAWSEDLVVFVGSLRIDSLGHVVPLSFEKDQDVVPFVPLNYKVTRIFWSSDSSAPYDKLRYQVLTGVKRKSEFCKPQSDINIVVDHADSRNQLVRKLNQVRSFHDWVDTTPIYLDEYGEEWYLPRKLNFTDSDSGDDADAEEDIGSCGLHFSKNETEEEDLFEECLTPNAITDLSSLAVDFIQNPSSLYWDMSVAHSSSSAAEAETEEDEELIVQVRQCMAKAAARRNLIPQVDGADSDSDTSTSRSSSSSSSSSSSAEEEMKLRTRSSKSRLAFKSEQKNSQKRSKAKALALATVTKAVVRNLRSRHKEPTLRHKVQEFKCQHCAKIFTSLSSVNRHTRSCKSANKPEKKKPLKREPMNMPTDIPLQTFSNEARKSSKKCKKTPPNCLKKVGQLKKSKSSSPVPSFSKIAVMENRKPQIIQKLETESSNDKYDIDKDGKVYCRACKNTYRTFDSYNNHLNNCTSCSSDSDDETETKLVVSASTPFNTEPTSSCIEYTMLESSSESETEVSSESSSSVDPEVVETETEISEEIFLEESVTTQEPFGVRENERKDASFEIEEARLIPVEEVLNSPVPDLDESSEDAGEEIEVPTNVPSTEHKELQIPTEQHGQFQEILTQFRSKDCTIQLKEVLPIKNFKSQEQEILDESNPEGEVVETPIEAEKTEENTSKYQQFVPNPNPTQPNPVFGTQNHLPQALDHHQQLPFHSYQDPLLWTGSQTRAPMHENGMSEFIFRPQGQQQFSPLSRLQQAQIESHVNQNFQQFQNFQNIQYPLLQNTPQHFLPRQVHQSGQPLQQVQTITMQDTNGQLVQVPVIHSVPENNQSSFMPNAQHNHQHQNAYMHSHFPFQNQGMQYDHYQHQLQQAQAAQNIQRQQFFQHQHQQMVLEQERRNQVLHQSQNRGHILGSPNSVGSGNIAAATSMLVSLTPHALENQQQSHHHQLPRFHHNAHHQNIPLESTECQATYFVVQSGNAITSKSGTFQPHSNVINQVSHSPLVNTNHYQVPSLVSPAEQTNATLPDKLRSDSTIAHLSDRSCAKTRTNSIAQPCPCADCIQRVSMAEQKRGATDWTAQRPLPTNQQLVRKLRPAKIRARLPTILSDRQSQGLQIFKASSTTTLPKLLPAAVTVGSDTFKTPASAQPISVYGTLSSASTTTPVSTVLSLLKPPTPSPNIAVVRPMEHPLQKMSDQIEQISSSFTSISALNNQMSQNNYSPIAIATTVPETWPQIPGTAVNIPSNSSVQSMQGNLESVTALENETPQTQIREEILTDPKSVVSPAPQDQKSADQAEPDTLIKILLKRQEGGDSYSINKVSGPAATTTQNQGIFKTLKIRGKITSGIQAGTSTDVVVQPVVHTVPIPDPNAEADDGESNRTIAEDDNVEEYENRRSLETSVVLPVPTSLDLGVYEKGQPREKTLRLTHRAVIVYEVKIDEKIQYKSCDVRAVWGYILERVQGTRRNLNLPPLSYPATNISLPDNKREAAATFNKLGLTHRAVQFLLEQLPGVSKAAKEGHVFKFHEPPKTSIEDTPVLENPTGCARSEGYKGRKPFDLFGWLASKHRQPEGPVTSASTRALEALKGGSLPIAMQYRNLVKYGTKHLNVFWSSIHGRGLFTTRNIEVGEVIIEYAGELIRSPVCDLREKYYESKGIGCYMFRIDDNYVVDATLKGNAARFINHSCDPNCRSKITEILGTKHILIFALRKIPSGEELTYDYKFEEEDGVKLPCSCGTHKCRKFLN